jgi:long-chain fatty acid transport protein
MLRRASLLASATVPALFAAAPAHAGAFYLQEQSIKAAGRAFSGEVSERGAQQMWWNPAAIGGITSTEIYGGIAAVRPHANARNVDTKVIRPTVTIPGVGTVPGSTSDVGGDQNEHNPVNNGYLPTGGFAMPLNEKFAVGINAAAPYGFTSNYASDSWARYSADKTRLRTYDIQPVIAFSPTPNISIGAGPNIEYVRATFSNYIPDPLPPIPGVNAGNDGYQFLKGSGWDVGYSVGAQFHNDRFDFGVSYKSKIRHTLKGVLQVSGFTDPVLIAQGANLSVTGARAQYTSPWQLDFGGRYHVSEQLTLNAQVVRFGWSKFDTLDLSNLGALGDESLPFGYRNTWSYAGGFDYALTPKLTVRGGVQRDLSPVVAGQRDPRVPDGNRWNFALGGSYALTDHIGLDASLGYAKIASNPIDKTTAAFVGTPLQTVVQTSGELDNGRAIVFGLGAHMSF